MQAPLPDRPPIGLPGLFYGWTIVAVLGYVGAITIMLAGPNLGLFIKPMGEVLGISAAMFGWCQTVRALAGAVSGPLLGRLMDVYGPRYLLAGAAVVSGVLTILMAQVSQAWQLLVLFAGLGLIGMSGPAQLYTVVPISKWFIRQRSRAFSLLFFGLVMGPTFLLPINQLLIDGIGWSATWVIIGLLAAITITPISVIFLRRQPEDLGLLPDGDPLVAEPAIPNWPVSGEAVAVAPILVAPIIRAVAEERSWTRDEAMHTRAFWSLGLAFSFTFFAGGSFVLFRIAHFVERGMDPTVVALGASADAFMFGLFALAGGVLGDRVPARLLAVGAFGTMFIAVVLVIFADSVPLMIFANGLWGSAAGANNIAQQIMWASYFGRAHQGSIRGVVAPLTVTIGSISGPLAGTLRELTGSYTTAWWIAAGLVLVGGLLVARTSVPIWKPRGQESPPLDPTTLSLSQP
ncbi:MAG: MFS transporter [Chloroflexi bacterium]|nr:MFS transporter [Chloroflexota bacterium]